ncbi:PilZ domain-containing protein [Sphingomonas sp. DT-204]|uniref:PilZ domain-containing protein n=1 Tax=Sphingomonas sp. DT-204 TaxID=3396166 RepID=UPI003F1D1240
MTDQPTPVERRAAPRVPTPVSWVSLHRVMGQPCDAILRDLSIYGCRIEGDRPRKPGASVRLSLDGSAPVAARVVWRDGAMMGCRFDTPIDRSLLRAIVLKLV